MSGGLHDHLLLARDNVIDGSVSSGSGSADAQSLPNGWYHHEGSGWHHDLLAPVANELLASRRATITLDDDIPSTESPLPPQLSTAATSNNSSNKQPLKYSRIMLKVSGEALQGALGFGVDANVMRLVAEEVRLLVEAGVRVAIVVGGGNYFRGANAWQGLDRATADYVGMLATVMNSLQLQGALESIGVDTRVQTAIEMREVAEPYIRRRAVAHLNAGRVVIFGAGTGNPFFTTDTAAALRAAEINADVFIKATKVDGIYDSDPAKNPLAKKYSRLSYKQCTADSLRVMDETAITLCKENGIPVMVLNMLEKGVFLKAAQGEEVGTFVCDGSLL